MSECVHESHNVSVLLYHFVFPAKYRRVVINESVDFALRDVCLEIEKRYELKFLEIGSDGDHIHFLVQSVPKNSVTSPVTLIKSLTARRVFERRPEVKKQPWGRGILERRLLCEHREQAWRRVGGKRLRRTFCRGLKAIEATELSSPNS